MSPSVLLVTHVLSNWETHTAEFNEKISILSLPSWIKMTSWRFKGEKNLNNISSDNKHGICFWSVSLQIWDTLKKKVTPTFTRWLMAKKQTQILLLFFFFFKGHSVNYVKMTKWHTFPEKEACIYFRKEIQVIIFLLHNILKVSFSVGAVEQRYNNKPFKYKLSCRCSLPATTRPPINHQHNQRDHRKSIRNDSEGWLFFVF